MFAVALRLNRVFVPGGTDHQNQSARFLAEEPQLIRQTELLNRLAVSEEDILVKVERILREIQRTSKQSAVLLRLYNGMTAEINPRFASQFAYEMESLPAHIYRVAIEEGKKAGDIREDIDAPFAAWLLDNLFMTLQFSYACDYYTERFRIYAGSEITDRDDFVVDQCLKFVKSALQKQN